MSVMRLGNPYRILVLVEANVDGKYSEVVFWGGGVLLPSATLLCASTEQIDDARRSKTSHQLLPPLKISSYYSDEINRSFLITVLPKVAQLVITACFNTFYL